MQPAPYYEHPPKNKRPQRDNSDHQPSQGDQKRDFLPTAPSIHQVPLPSSFFSQSPQQRYAILDKFLSSINPSFNNCIEHLLSFSNSVHPKYLSPIITCYCKHLKELNPTKDQCFYALTKHPFIHTRFLHEYILTLYDRDYVEGNLKELVQEVWRVFDQGFIKRGCILVDGFELEYDIGVNALFRFLAKRVTNFGDCGPLFQGRKKFAEQFVTHIPNIEDKKKFIKVNGLDINQFPDVVKYMEEQSLRYEIRTYGEDFCQLKFKTDMPKMCFFIGYLQRKNKKRAMMLVKKYNLYDRIKDRGFGQKVFREKDNILVEDNVLERLDGFGPTQRIVFKSQNQYLELKDFGIEEKDVYVVDKIDQNFDRAKKELTTAKIVGFDCEFTTSATAPSRLDFIQLSTHSSVFLIDYQPLKSSPQLPTLMTQLFCVTPQTLIIGFSLSQDLKLLCQNLKITPKSNKLIDILPQLKQLLGGGLRSVCEKAFKPKLFSKYEQCSNWGLRPLRKTQKHYAALDARVLVELWERREQLKEEFAKKKLEKEENQKKKEETGVKIDEGTKQKIFEVMTASKTTEQIPLEIAYPKIEPKIQQIPIIPPVQNKPQAPKTLMPTVTIEKQPTANQPSQPQPERQRQTQKPKYYDDDYRDFDEHYNTNKRYRKKKRPVEEEVLKKTPKEDYAGEERKTNYGQQKWRPAEEASRGYKDQRDRRDYRDDRDNRDQRDYNPKTENRDYNPRNEPQRPVNYDYQDEVRLDKPDKKYENRRKPKNYEYFNAGKRTLYREKQN